MYCPAAVVPAPHALPLRPRRNTGAQFFDHANNIRAREPANTEFRPEGLLHKHIAVADATSLYLDQHLARTRLRNLTLDNLEPATRFGICAALIVVVATLVVAITSPKIFNLAAVVQASSVSANLRPVAGIKHGSRPALSYDVTQASASASVGK